MGLGLRPFVGSSPRHRSISVLISARGNLCDLRFKEMAPDAEGRDTAMACKWGGDPREEAAASTFCAALAKKALA